MAAVRRRWEEEELVADKRQLEWRGHIPKNVPLGWLSQPHPCGGPRRRWRSVLKEDLQHIGVKDKWYKLASHYLKR